MFRSEEQWEIIGYCDHCGCTLYAMGDNTQWASEFCGGASGGHTLENEVDLEVLDDEI